MMRKENVVILGSTGSIGINTLKVIERYKERFNVVGLSAYNNVKLLEKQVNKFRPDYVAVNDDGRSHFRKAKRPSLKVLDVDEDLEELVTRPSVDIVVIAMRGSAALLPFLSAVRKGKRVAPANKEALVVAGEILMKEARKHNAEVIPIDSEQSAIFQCLQGHNRGELKKVILTASGGTLRDIPRAKFDTFTVEEMLKHPTWKMGAKITVDSAMLLNKGFEVIEALRLFDLKFGEIEVVIHPQSIIHSMVAYKDGSIIAQLGQTDMRIPIQYALSYPQRWETGFKPVDFVGLKQLTFAKPDLKKFPALALAMHTARRGGTLPAVLNAADEVAVDAYLKGTIGFTKIYAVLERVVSKHRTHQHLTLKKVFEADAWAREEAKRVIGT
jgi:1-deoxy-D-xylulose-5-phosphate reductoisomerase